MNDEETSDMEPDTSIPEVNELEERLRDVDAAMELLQSGELDAAEAAIEALETRAGRNE
jgi:soluble cytochrome b562